MRKISSRTRLAILGTAIVALVACSSDGNAVAPSPATDPGSVESIPSSPIPEIEPSPGSTRTPAAVGSTAQSTPVAAPMPTVAPKTTHRPQSDETPDQVGPGNTPSPGSGDPWSYVSERECGGGAVFSAFPMDLKLVTNLSPLGLVNPPGHTFPTSHMYFAVPQEMGEPGEGPFGDGQVFPPTPVYAVADGVLSSLSVSTVTTSLSGKEVTYTEYGFDVTVCEGVRVRYGHVGPVSDQILESVEGLEGFNCNAYSTGDFAVDGCTYAPFLELEAGEQVGFNSGRAAALDIGVFDSKTQTIDFPHPQLMGEEAAGALCLLDFYSPDQAAELAAILGNGELLRTEQPICGVLNFDVPGTLQGNWFNRIDTFSQEDLNIAFIYDQVIPDQPIVSIGFVPGIDSAAHMFTPRDEGRTNRHFAEVAEGDGIYCYEQFRDRFDRVHPDVHLLVDVAEPGRLLAQAVDGPSCGDGPWEFEGSVTEFVR